MLVLCQIIYALYIGRGNPVPTNGSTYHLCFVYRTGKPRSYERFYSSFVLCISDGETPFLRTVLLIIYALYIGRGNPVPTNGSTYYLSVDRTVVLC